MRGALLLALILCGCSGPTAAQCRPGMTPILEHPAPDEPRDLHALIARVDGATVYYRCVY